MFFIEYSSMVVCEIIYGAVPLASRTVFLLRTARRREKRLPAKTASVLFTSPKRRCLQFDIDFHDLSLFVQVYRCSVILRQNLLIYTTFRTLIKAFDFYKSP